MLCENVQTAVDILHEVITHVFEEEPVIFEHLLL